MFHATHGELMGLSYDYNWKAVSRLVRSDTVVIALPEISEMIENYPTTFSSGKAKWAMSGLMQDILGVDVGRYEAGDLKPRARLFKMHSDQPIGQAIFMDEYAYRVMARQMIWMLADAEEGARVMGFMDQDLYRNAFLPNWPAKPEEGAANAPSAEGQPAQGDKTKARQNDAAHSKGEWSEMREIARNMLSAALCDEEDLGMLQERAVKTENFGFLELIAQHRELLKQQKYRRDSGREGGGYGR
jgi:hypothetical protein